MNETGRIRAILDRITGPAEGCPFSSDQCAVVDCAGGDDGGVTCLFGRLYDALDAEEPCRSTSL